MKDYVEVLKKYWGYDSFRPLQKEVIDAILSGKDTLVLMPTGGGKSITFQVPALLNSGLCIVITPLIALMKDQVENLKRKNIRAVAVYTGLNKKEISNSLDKCIYGDVKFLYISPERLASHAFKIKMQQMNISIFAVDEAHCISEWGYDFRPSYLKISEVREFFPKVPILALTATATPDVVKDIQDKLRFKKENVLQKSFERKNLTYVVRYTENKEGQLLSILKKNAGSSIVYVRNRKKAKELADYLCGNNIKSGFYHAGLTFMQRNACQELWMKNGFRVMVATNAFGMGIDKPDVRVVVHYDIPDTIESYFQEAGRSGRDGIKSYAILIWDSSDEGKLKKRISSNFPEKNSVKKVYTALGNYLQVQEGDGLNMSFRFNLAEFSRFFKLNILQAYSSLKILQGSGYIELTDEVDKPTSLMFLPVRDELYGYRSVDENAEKLIKLLLRTYTGLFSSLTRVDEDFLAGKLGISVEKIWDYFNMMSKQKILQIIPQLKTPYIIYTQPKLPESYIKLSASAYADRRKRFIKRIDAIWNYVSNTRTCRSQLLLRYFGEKNSKECGRCDVCVQRRKNDSKLIQINYIKNKVIDEVKLCPISPESIISNISENKDFVYEVISRLLEDEEIYLNSKGELEIK